MTDADPDPNPDAIPGAPQPFRATYRVEGTDLYAEVRGAGTPILLIPGGGEDAEGWRGVAERVAGHTVVSYDRRGTLRSGREDWPGGGSAQHADDAAALLRILGLRKVTAVGASSAAIIAVQLAMRHPARVGRVLAYEPGYFAVVAGGDAIMGPARDAMRAYLQEHSEDWVGAYAAFGRAASPSPSAEPRGFLAPPPGREWFARREDRNAEAIVRDDIPSITAEHPDLGALAALPLEVRFGHGTASPALFRSIAETLAAVRGDVADIVDGTGHSLYLHPDQAAAYISLRAGA